MSGLNELNNNLMKIKLSQKQNKLATFIYDTKIGLFRLFNELLKDYKPSLLFECVSIIIQYCQLLYFPFNGYVRIFFKFSLM